jgi:outer membrane protein assembly factor BamA
MPVPRSQLLCCFAVTLVVGSGGCRHVPPAVVPADSVLVEDVRFDGFDVLTVDEIEDLREEVDLRPGAALTSEIEERAGTAAVRALQNHGYPYARVRIARETLAGNRARVVIHAEPGVRGYFGPIEITGHRSVEDAIIRRRLAYFPGDLFRRSALEQSHQQIAALGLFRSVDLRTANVDSSSADVPTIVTVVERSPWRWNLSLGYSAGERLGVEGRVSHLNFLGSARRVDFEGGVSRIDRRVEAAFTQTDTWHPAVSLSAEARNAEIDADAFNVLTRGGQASLTWRRHSESAITVSYASALERSRVDAGLALLTGLRDGMLNAWSIDIDHRTLSLHLEQAGGWMPGTFHYYNLIGEARHYRQMLEGRLLLGGRLRYGAINPMASEEDIPLLKRFFLGGSSEMRGWGRYEVSPLSETGMAVGGKSFMSAAGEVRFRVTPRVYAVAFVEAGNAWPDPWSADLGNLLYDAGPGMRFGTPFGLLRVDLGYQLKLLKGLHIEGQPQKHRWRLHVAVGEAF